MNNLILDYMGWNSINEGLFWDVIEREPLGGTTHKVKVKYIDTNNIKVKAVNDVDMVKPDGTIDPALPAALVNFLKTHDGTDFAKQYPQLQDINAFYKDNFFTYNVKKESDSRQVIIFSLQKRANFKNVGADVKALSDAQAAQLAQAPEAKNILGASDKSLAQNTAATTAAAPATQVKLEQPILIANLGSLGAKDPLFQLIDNTVAGLSASAPFADAKAKDVLSKSADELEGQMIGDNTILLVKALMAGLGIGTYTNKYGKVKERTQIVQTVADKLATLTAPAKGAAPAATTAQNSSKSFYLGLDGRAIFEQEDDAKAVATAVLPGDFKMAEFLKVIAGTTATAAVSTGDIKVPDGGFVKGKVAKGDAELKKVQQLIIDKFAKKLANSPIYKKFAGFGADGTYGPTTEKIIAGLKAGFGLSDKNGAIITAELINKIQTEKIDESYLTNDGSLFEAFDMDAYTSTIKAYTPSTSPTASGKSATDTTSSSKAVSSAGFNVDKIAEKMWTAIARFDNEKEEVVYEIFEKDIKSDAQLQKFLKYWKGLKFPRKRGLLISGPNWQKAKDQYKEKEADSTNSLEYWLNNLFDPAEAAEVNKRVAKYSKWQITGS